MYGSAAAFSKSLGNAKAANLFHDALMNEKEMDEKLSKLAEEKINSRATAPIMLGEKD
jgi:ferritin-like metal-binding protein YciE